MAHLIPVVVAGVEVVHLNQVGEVEVAEGLGVHIQGAVVVAEEVEHLIQVAEEGVGEVAHLIQVGVVGVELVFHIQVAEVGEEEGVEGLEHLIPVGVAGVGVLKMRLACFSSLQSWAYCKHCVLKLHKNAFSQDFVQ